MGAFRRFLRRLVNALWSAGDGGLDREIAAHLAFLEDEYRRQGLAPVDARRSARLALGGVEQTKELHRAARSFIWIDHARRDAIYAFRMLRRRPVATFTAAVSLAVGIGLNTAVFSVVDWVLVRPLPYPVPDQLVRVHTAGTAPVTSPGPLTHAEFDTLRASTVFHQSAGFSSATRVIGGGGIHPVHAVVTRVSGDIFGTIGIHADIGRTFSAEEIGAGTPVVVLSRAVWQRAFLADQAIAGRIVTIEGAPYTVIGVAARGYPSESDIWRPSTSDERRDQDRDLDMLGRLRDEATVSAASSEMAALERSASGNTRTAWVEDVQRTSVRDVHAALSAVFAATLLVLGIACANVAALLAARSADRAGEIAMRGALGATRVRLAAQLLTEGVVLAAIGGALGLLFGQWTLRALLAIAPAGVPRLADIVLDRRILVMAAGATLVTGLAVGIVPAIRFSRGAFDRAGSERVAPRSRGRRGLVLAQVALAVVLTASAGLLMRSLQHLAAIDHGFAPDNLIAVDVFLRGGFPGDTQQLFRTLIASTESVPGVRRAAVAMRLPTQVAGIRAPVRIVGESAAAVPSVLRPVSWQYFDTVRIPILAGRAFAASDSRNAAGVAIVNRTFLRDVLGGRAAVGVRLTTPLVRAPVTIVGVVGDTTPAGEAERPALYVPTEQVALGGGYLVVSARGDPRAVVPLLTEQLRAAAPALALDRMRPVADMLAESRALARFTTELALVFAALAVLLSIVGVYGLVSGEVTARWREIAIRVALGSSERDVLWTVIRPSVVLLAAGAFGGAIGALGAGRALTSLLRGVGAADGPTLAAAAGLLWMTGVAAAFVAGSRVLGTDPAAILRNE